MWLLLVIKILWFCLVCFAQIVLLGFDWSSDWCVCGFVIGCVVLASVCYYLGVGGGILGCCDCCVGGGLCLL